jgi:broad specificity phosphatase PhoE
MTVVHVVRHGEVYNPDRILYGRLPGFRLSDRGVEQAEKVATFLADRPIGCLVSSPLERAQQTAAPLAGSLGLQIDIDYDLIEAANRLEGKPVAGGQGLFTDPSNLKYYRNPFKPSWGEPYSHIAARMVSATSRARKDAEQLGDGVEAVCVSHQLPIVALRRFVEGQRLFHDPRKRQCALASVTSLTFDGDVVVRVDYAEPAGPTPKDYVGGA